MKGNASINWFGRYLHMNQVLVATSRWIAFSTMIQQLIRPLHLPRLCHCHRFHFLMTC